METDCYLFLFQVHGHLSTLWLSDQLYVSIVIFDHSQNHRHAVSFSLLSHNALFVCELHDNLQCFRLAHLAKKGSLVSARTGRMKLSYALKVAQKVEGFCFKQQKSSVFLENVSQ